MRVAIDARGVHSKLQGIGRHVLNLLLGLSFRESDLEFVVFYNDPLARKLVERGGGPYRGRFQWVRAMADPGQVFEKVEIPWLLKIHRADLFHDVAGTGVWTANIPVVATVHELAGLHFKTGNDPDKIRRGLRDSRLIISVSQSLADEIESNFNISRPKIRVISNAIDPWYNERVAESEIRHMRERFKLPSSYFLCVTANRPNKNSELVQRLASEWTGPEQFVFTIPGVESEKLRYLDIVEDTWLRPLYAACAALVAPSLYEGFSLPPIEALATGSIPVVSSIPPHRETLSGVIMEDQFFEAASAEALAGALRKTIDGGESLKRAVLEQFRLTRDRYSAAETAGRVHAVYHEALRG